jgi:hypothetical protein
MSGRKLLLYLAVLLLVAGGYFFSEYRHSRQVAQEKAAKEVFQVKAADIKALTLKNDKGEIVLQRTPAPEKTPEPAASATPAAAAGEWRLTKPVAAKADELTIDSLLSALADLKMQRHLDQVPAEKMKEFGLDKPIFTVGFQVGDQTHQLSFGSKAPGNQNFYAQKDNEPQVLLIRIPDKETLDRTVTALRSKKIFSLSPDKVTEIRVIHQDERLRLSKAAPTEWTPGTPLQLKLRGDKINSLLNHIAGAKASEFVAEKADDLKKYGLVPSPTLRLTLLAGKQEETLLIGSKQGDRYYAQISGTDPIMLVDKSVVENLPASYDALEDRRLWTGADTAIQKVIWGPPDKLAAAARDQNGWRLLQADKSPGPQEANLKVTLAFMRLKDLEFTRLLPAAETKKEKVPLYTLLFLGPEDKPLFRLEEISADTDQVQVRFSQEDKTLVGTVPAKTFNQLKEALGGLAAPAPKPPEKSPAGK